MSEEPRDLYYHDPFNNDKLTNSDTNLSFLNSNSSMYTHIPDSSSQNLLGFHPSPYTECLHGSTDYNTLARAFGLSPSPSEAFSSLEKEQKPAVDAGDLMGCGETPVTPNSSVFSSSMEADEAGGDNEEKEKQPKGRSEDGEEISKQVNKLKKKGEKKEKEPRFAFMTKSEVDQLEDGYRWRKYGQKAVKNSPYPRSYYRCTTKNCTVKKRVERSFQDPSTVITTYEGQHNHHLPATLRGNSAGMFPPSMISPAVGSSFPHGLVVQTMPHINNYGGATSNYHQSLGPLQQLHLPHDDEYGLLQDMVPSMMFKQEQ